MSNNVPPNPAAPQAKDGTFSLEDLDQIIAAEDPNFAVEMDKLKTQGVEGSAALENLSISTEDEVENKAEEKEKTKKQKVIAFILAPVRKLKSVFLLRLVAFKNRSIVLAQATYMFIRNELPDRLRYYRSEIAKFFAMLKGKYKTFQAFSSLQKAALYFGVFSISLSLFFIYKSVGGRFLPRYIDPLPRSLQEGSDFSGAVTDKEQIQHFLAAFPEVEYYILLRKLVVNLRPDDGSGPNPMGAFEFYIGVDAKDTAVEVKDREDEMVDVVQRTIEGFSYSEVASEMGKVRMKAAIRDNLNKILNQGYVYKIYFNNIVIYGNN